MEQNSAHILHGILKRDPQLTKTRQIAGSLQQRGPA
jgi:hypothetical protein